MNWASPLRQGEVVFNFQYFTVLETLISKDYKNTTTFHLSRSMGLILTNQ